MIIIPWYVRYVSGFVGVGVKLIGSKISISRGPSLGYCIVGLYYLYKSCTNNTCCMGCVDCTFFVLIV